MLEGALDLIAADGGTEAQIVCVGDYTDRGPDSRAVIERLIALRAKGAVCIKGNHDRMFWRAVAQGDIDDPAIKSGKSWLHHRLGGGMTLRSYMDVPELDPLDHYGKDPAFEGDLAALITRARIAVPQAHLDFIEGLPLWHQAGDLMFVHAGLRPGLALEKQSEDDLIWIRDDWLEYDGAFPWLVVHGHTALDAPQHHGNRINLDGGAGYGRPLLPAVFEGRNCWLLTDRGRVSLSE